MIYHLILVVLTNVLVSPTDWELAKLIGNDYWREKVWQTSDILDHISTCLLTYSLIRFDER